MISSEYPRNISRVREIYVCTQIIRHDLQYVVNVYSLRQSDETILIETSACRKRRFDVGR